MNLWHDVPLGENAPEEINVIVEIPKGSNNKYEIDNETGLIKLVRTIPPQRSLMITDSSPRPSGTTTIHSM